MLLTKTINCTKIVKNDPNAPRAYVDILKWQQPETNLVISRIQTFLLKKQTFAEFDARMLKV